MFTGIIEQTGTLISLRHRRRPPHHRRSPRPRRPPPRRRLARRLRRLPHRARRDRPYFHADLAQETLDKTSLGALAPGAKVNLELPTAAGSPLGGHIVQGHVDGCGVMTALDPVIPASSPTIRPADHRLDPQSSGPGKRPPLDGPQGLGRCRRHQPHHRRL